MIKDYELVIGLEVHIELKTKSKIFCSCPTTFGAEPNTQCCPICMGLPGTLPVLNRNVVDYAIKAGIATNCTISEFSKQDRKNYFYPDLPKAYQISQFDLPLCSNGYIEIENESGTKKIGITRIHIEEDAGKLIHDDEKGTLIDCNRCGMALIEIVSEPDIRSADEALAYLKKLRATIIYTGVSDCKMNEGSLRCDVNLSVRKKGASAFGTRTEMKNLNSFQFIAKAIEYEYKRQVEAVEAGETIIQETRRFDANLGKTFSMRTKENADDYRYFPDPDLPYLEISKEKLEELKAQIPQLPDERKAVYIKKYSLSAMDSENLTNDKNISDYFESAVTFTTYPKILANLITGELFRILPQDFTETDLSLSPEYIAKIAEMLGSGRINGGTAKNLLKNLWENPQDPENVVKSEGLEQINDENILIGYINEVIDANPKSVEDYKKGKKAAQKALMGQVMSKTSGKGNPVMINDLLLKILEN